MSGRLQANGHHGRRDSTPATTDHAVPDCLSREGAPETLVELHAGPDSLASPFIREPGTDDRADVEVTGRAGRIDEYREATLRLSTESGIDYGFRWASC